MFFIKTNEFWGRHFDSFFEVKYPCDWKRVWVFSIMCWLWGFRLMGGVSGLGLFGFRLMLDFLKIRGLISMLDFLSI